MADSSQVVPSVFIGSSSEGLEVARSVEFNLKDDAEVTLWHHGAFGLNKGYLESLVEALERFDFAILVLTPDDFVSSRNVVLLAPRDNIMFELGLFMGALGRNRTFAVCSDDPRMKIPTDLAGVNLLQYRSSRADGNLLSATSPACTLIRKSIKELGLSGNRGLKRLASATSHFEGLSDKVTRIIYLMARSRILELEHIKNQFGSFLPSEFTEKLIQDISLLKSETEPQSD